MPSPTTSVSPAGHDEETTPVVDLERIHEETPVVDLDRIHDTYTELKKMQVSLDPNPIEYGPRRFNHRIAQVRAMLNRVDQIFLQVSEDLHLFKRIINARRTLYEFEKRELMVNDPKVRIGRSQGEREAFADVQLVTQLERLAELELAAHDLETLMISIKSKRTDLKDAQSRMRDQMKMIEHDLGMGARWGSNAALSSASQSVGEINDLLADVDAKLGIVAGEDEEEGDGEEDAVAVDAGHDPSPQAEEEPVLVFGEGDSSDDQEEGDGEEDIENLLPDEGADGELPAADNSQEDVESFLGSIDTEGDEEADEGEDDGEDDASGIDDLIASLADD